MIIIIIYVIERLSCVHSCTGGPSSSKDAARSRTCRAVAGRRQGRAPSNAAAGKWELTAGATAAGVYRLIIGTCDKIMSKFDTYPCTAYVVPQKSRPISKKALFTPIRHDVTRKNIVNSVGDEPRRVCLCRSVRKWDLYHYILYCVDNVSS